MKPQFINAGSQRYFVGEDSRPRSQIQLRISGSGNMLVGQLRDKATGEVSIPAPYISFLVLEDGTRVAASNTNLRTDGHSGDGSSPRMRRVNSGRIAVTTDPPDGCSASHNRQNCDGGKKPALAP